MQNDFKWNAMIQKMAKPINAMLLIRALQRRIVSHNGLFPLCNSITIWFNDRNVSKKGRICKWMNRD